MINWAKELEQFGIPADRVKLVERNMELKGKLGVRGAAIQSIREAHHKAYSHEGALDDCPNGVCSGLKAILDRSNA